MVVRSRGHGQQVDGRIEAGGTGGAERAGEPAVELGTDSARVQEGSTLGGELAPDAPCHDVARCKVAVGMKAGHEAASGAVDQRRTGTAQGLGQEREWIGWAGERGRVELHELDVSHYRAGSYCYGEAVARGLDGVGGACIYPADAPGSENHCRGQHYLVAPGRIDHHGTHDAAPGTGKVDNVGAFPNLDLRVLVHRVPQRPHHLPAGGVAVGMHDPVCARVLLPGPCAEIRRRSGRTELPGVAAT